MADNNVSLPGAFGGLMHFNEEYASKINLKPTHVMIFIILIIVFRVSLSVFLN